MQSHLFAPLRASRLRRETLLCPKRTRYALRAHAPRTRTALARLCVRLTYLLLTIASRKL